MSSSTTGSRTMRNTSNWAKKVEVVNDEIIVELKDTERRSALEVAMQVDQELYESVHGCDTIRPTRGGTTRRVPCGATM